MEMGLTFDDVLIVPNYSTVNSRQNVDITSCIMGDMHLSVPVFSANMDTVTGVRMAKAMSESGGMGVLHRFSSIEDNVKMYLSHPDTAVSIGISDNEMRRAEALRDAGARYFFIDVAHGAQRAVVDFTLSLKAMGVKVCVGNFASGTSLFDFLMECGSVLPDAVKIGVGPGSVCTTRIMTGVGVPQLSAIMACTEVVKRFGPISVIADGGIKSPGDIAKALLAGADAVMVGGMLAGTDEAPRLLTEDGEIQYRGSASKESYDTQKKTAEWRCAEGVSKTVKPRGPVADIMQSINGGLRSSFSYVGATTLAEFKERGHFIQVTASGRLENGAHFG